MKTILTFILAAIATPLAQGADIIFESKNEKVLILEKTIQWISKRTDFVEIGTTSGVFEIKGGKGDSMFWPFVYVFKLDPNEILWKSLTIKKDIKNRGLELQEERKYRESLEKMVDDKSPLTEGFAGSLIAEGCANDDFECESIVFKPHDH